MLFAKLAGRKPSQFFKGSVKITQIFKPRFVANLQTGFLCR